jgi:HPt (histidine-containing phosphotransfer) domain-containing protein
MADDYQNDVYRTLLEKLGPEQSLVLIEKLMIDVKNTRRGLQAALSAKAADLLNEPSHVLISLAGAVGAVELHGLAKKINEFKPLKQSDFPLDAVRATLDQLDQWLRFLKSDKAVRGQKL